MAETQMSMFGDSEQLHALIDRLDDIPDDELKKNWPGTLRDLVDVISAELHRQGIEPAQAGMLARKVAAAQAGYMGGVVIISRSVNPFSPNCAIMRFFPAGARAKKLKPCAAITGCQKPRFIPSYANSAVCIWQERNRHFSDIPQSLPPFLHRYADSENIMRQRNNAKTPRTTA